MISEGSAQRNGREVDSFERTGEEGRGRPLSQFIVALGIWMIVLKRGVHGKSGAHQERLKEIAFGHCAALLYLQINSAVSG